MSREFNSEQRQRRNNVVARWLQTSVDQTAKTSSEKSKEDRHDRHHYGDTSDGVASILQRALQQKPDGGRGPFDGFDNPNIPDKREPISDFSFIADIIHNVSADSASNSSTYEKGSEPDTDDDLEADNDSISYRLDQPFNYNDEEYERVLCEIASRFYSKPVTGVHRYVSTVIVPPGVDGVQRCLRELDSLITKFPPTHWYIVASHADHIHISHMCSYSSGACRCSWINRGLFYTRYRRRRLRRISGGAKLRPVDWRNIIRYLSTGGRSISRIGGHSEDVGLYNRYKHLSEARHIRQAQGGLLAGSDSTSGTFYATDPFVRTARAMVTRIAKQLASQKNIKKTRKNRGFGPKTGR